MVTSASLSGYAFAQAAAAAAGQGDAGSATCLKPEGARGAAAASEPGEKHRAGLQPAVVIANPGPEPEP